MKCDEKYLGRTEGRTEVKQYTPSPFGERGYKNVYPEIAFYCHIHLYMHIFRRIFLNIHWWQESDIWSQASYRYAILWEAFLDPSDSYSTFTCCSWCTNKMNCELMLTYDTPALQQTGSRNLTGPKTLPMIWGTYMKLVTKYQISAINSCWEKCAYMLKVDHVCFRSFLIWF
jgi:hypothetical protein